MLDIYFNRKQATELEQINSQVRHRENAAEQSIARYCH